MIITFVGTPGSGKSYDAVRKIYDNLRLGRRVYTNIEGMDGELQQEMLKNALGLGDYDFKKLFHFLSDKEIEHFWEIVKDGSLVVIDEVHKRFNCRDWNSKKNLDFANWSSTHRHHGFDLILVTQDIDKVEKQVRSLVEWSYVYRKVNFLGSIVKNKYIVYSYSGDDCHGKPLATNTRTYDLFIFSFYKSFNTDQQAEVGIMSHVNILKHPVFFAIPIFVCIFLYLFFVKSSFATGDLFGSRKIATRERALRKPVLGPSSSIPSTVLLDGRPAITSSSVVPPSGSIVHPSLGSSANVLRSYSGVVASSVSSSVPFVSGYVLLGNYLVVLLSDKSTVKVKGASRVPDIGLPLSPKFHLL